MDYSQIMPIVWIVLALIVVWVVLQIVLKLAAKVFACGCSLIVAIAVILIVAHLLGQA